MNAITAVLRRGAGLFLIGVFVIALGLWAGSLQAQTNDRAVAPDSPVEGAVPGQSLGNIGDAEMWRSVRHGITGKVSLPNEQAGVLVQSEGENWRAVRNGPVTVAGLWIMGGMIVLLALFFLVRGRIRVESGWSGHTITRFNFLERFAHWLTASCFVVLALTGLNMLYGKHILLPVFGAEAFSLITLGGKYAHNYLAFGFMVGLVLMFVLWVRHNLFNRYDLFWIGYGGGLFSKGLHPPARKFNFGQKVIFWSVILGGLSLSLSGLALMFPFSFALFEPTFVAMNAIGINVPTGITAMEEMQLSQIWHSIMGLLLIAIILAHIYIGSLGMEGAFDAVGTGEVDENWAREHHAVWVAEMKGEPIPEPDDIGHEKPQPAE